MDRKHSSQTTSCHEGSGAQPFKGLRTVSTKTAPVKMMRYTVEQNIAPDSGSVRGGVAGFFLKPSPRSSGRKELQAAVQAGES